MRTSIGPASWRSVRIEGIKGEFVLLGSIYRQAIQTRSLAGLESEGHASIRGNSGRPLQIHFATIEWEYEDHFACSSPEKSEGYLDWLPNWQSHRFHRAVMAFAVPRRLALAIVNHHLERLFILSVLPTGRSGLGGHLGEADAGYAEGGGANSDKSFFGHNRSLEQRLLASRSFCTETVLSRRRFEFTARSVTPPVNRR